MQGTILVYALVHSTCILFWWWLSCLHVFVPIFLRCNCIKVIWFMKAVYYCCLGSLSLYSFFPCQNSFTGEITSSPHFVSSLITSANILLSIIPSTVWHFHLNSRLICRIVMILSFHEIWLEFFLRVSNRPISSFHTSFSSFVRVAMSYRPSLPRQFSITDILSHCPRL